MIAFIIPIIYTACAIFWLIQLLDLLFRHPMYFESHTHKLLWFLVIFVGNIFGAIWYYFWKQSAQGRIR